MIKRWHLLALFLLIIAACAVLSEAQTRVYGPGTANWVYSQLIWNKATNTFQGWDGSAWKDIGGGGTGTPGGSNGEIQFNSASAFAGVAGSVADATTGSITLTAGAATTTPMTIVGAPGQTAPLAQWKDSTGAALSDINALGVYDNATAEVTIANKNKYRAIINESGTPLIRHLTYYWGGIFGYSPDNSYGFGVNALQNNTGNSSNGLGASALQNNTGANSNGFGYYALHSNAGGYSSGFGDAALQNNTGNASSGFGVNALQNNTGNSSNGLGASALQNNTGGYSNGFGVNALQNNTGANSNGFGYYALHSNAGGYSNGFGYYALQNNNWGYSTAFGYQSGLAFTPDPATDKAFAYVDIDATVHTITFASPHGFGTVGGKINLLFTLTAGAAPAGLINGTVYQFTVTSTTVLTYSGITSQGSADFTGKLTNSVDTSYSTAIGYGSNATKAHQVMLGDPTTVETYVNGTLKLTDLSASGTVQGATVRLSAYTVATLPTGTVGDNAYVTDATAPSYLSPVTGGGSVTCPVFFDGANWVAH